MISELSLSSEYVRCLCCTLPLETSNSWCVCVVKWNFNSNSIEKVFAQMLQGYILRFSCVRLTWLSCAACEANAFPQNLHLNGRSPLCWRRCVRRMDEAVNDFGQCGQAYGRSPVCTRECLFKLLDWEKRLPQVLHTCGLYFWWTWSMWIRRRSFFSNDLWQRWQGNLRSPLSTHLVYFKCFSR